MRACEHGKWLEVGHFFRDEKKHRIMCCASCSHVEVFKKSEVGAFGPMSMLSFGAPYESCKTCKRWSEKEQHHTGSFEFGDCDAAAFDMEEMEVSDMALSPCGHGSGIVTGEDFGCIHWEPKP